MGMIRNLMMNIRNLLQDFLEMRKIQIKMGQKKDKSHEITVVRIQTAKTQEVVDNKTETEISAKIQIAVKITAMEIAAKIIVKIQNLMVPEEIHALKLAKRLVQQVLHELKLLVTKV